MAEDRWQHLNVRSKVGILYFVDSKPGVAVRVFDLRMGNKYCILKDNIDKQLTMVLLDFSKDRKGELLSKGMKSITARQLSQFSEPESLRKNCNNTTHMQDKYFLNLLSNGHLIILPEFLCIGKRKYSDSFRTLGYGILNDTDTKGLKYYCVPQVKLGAFRPDNLWSF